MNKIYMITSFFFLNLICSQNNFGEIIYSIKIKEKDFSKSDTIKSNDKKEIANYFSSLLKRKLEKKIVLSFNDSISFQTDFVELDPKDFSSNSNSDLLYINTKTNTYINQVEFYGKLFLVNDTLKKIVWEINDTEVKKINGYNCKKAFYKEENITVWFSEEILSNQGPNLYRGLPGLIFELETKDFLFKCDKIEINKKNVIKIPNKGKDVTAREFELIKYNKTLEVLGGNN